MTELTEDEMEKRKTRQVDSGRQTLMHQTLEFTSTVAEVLRKLGEEPEAAHEVGYAGQLVVRELDVNRSVDAVQRREAWREIV